MMIPSQYLISNEAEIVPLATKLIEGTPQNRIWAFYGKMGAGKTTFIRTLCRELGVKENVTSPTFSLVNEYDSTLLREPVYHFDFYRIENESEAVDIGCEEYFESGRLCLIEWPEKILNLLPHPHLKINITVEESKRRITFSYD